MSEALFATGVPFGTRAGLGQSLAEVGRLMPGTAGLRRWGAASLDLAYVAAGRFDGFWERGLGPWDLAAGMLLVREAGGFAGGIDPAGDPLTTGEIIAANAGLFEPFAALVRGG